MKTGIDITLINRFSNISESFLRKTFTENEINYIKKTNNSAQTIAGLYCAKEAFLKAIKKGISAYHLKDIEINHEESGSPFIKLYGTIQNDISYSQIDVSISHDGDYAISIVTILCI